MTRTPDPLEDLFAAASAAPPPPLPADLMARLTAAAGAARPPSGPSAAARPGWAAWARALLAEIGGAPALGGLVAAGAVGLWVGLADPAGAVALVLDLSGTAASPFDLFDPDL